MEHHRIMVVGCNVMTVQRVSRYCLKLGAKVFPSYGLPTAEEVTLFTPEVSVLCLPVPESFLRQISQPYILWSEHPLNIGLPLVYSYTELEAHIRDRLK